MGTFDQGDDLGHGVHVFYEYVVPCDHPGEGDCNVVSDHTTHLVAYASLDRVPAGAVGPVGLMEWHRIEHDEAQGANGTRGWCGGHVSFEESHHTLVSLVPLTVQPSLLCPVCGNHGYITDGRWVPVG